MWEGRGGAARADSGGGVTIALYISRLTSKSKNPPQLYRNSVAKIKAQILP
jgi:hypothetical protein